MKAGKINKSKIMKKAWFYFRTYKGAWDFSYCLKRAWKGEKESIAIMAKYEEEKRSKVIYKSVADIGLDAYERFYSNSRYIGD